jgi:hypothetical protein
METGLPTLQHIVSVDRQYNNSLIPCHRAVHALNDGFKTCAKERQRISHEARILQVSHKEQHGYRFG